MFMIKWSDQSRFRELFSMEWYVLGNGPMDYSALHPTQLGKAVDAAAAAAAAADEASGLGGFSIISKLPRKAGLVSARAETAHSSSSSSSSKDTNSGQVLGWQYSGYPNGLSAEQQVSTATHAAAAAAADAGFNTVEAGVVAATKSLFSGELDGQKFMPQRTGGHLQCVMHCALCTIQILHACRCFSCAHTRCMLWLDVCCLNHCQSGIAA
jgi:hypothetical protein